MHKFDGSNPTKLVSQMEKYFSLHDIGDDETKLHVGVLYLDQENDSGGGGGIINVILDTPLGTCSPKQFVHVLIGNLIFWESSLSCAKLDQYQTSSQCLNNWIS
jgi:hypothetical protein